MDASVTNIKQVLQCLLNIIECVCLSEMEHMITHILETDLLAAFQHPGTYYF